MVQSLILLSLLMLQQRQRWLKPVKILSTALVAAIWYQCPLTSWYNRILRRMYRAQKEQRHSRIPLPLVVAALLVVVPGGKEGRYRGLFTLRPKVAVPHRKFIAWWVCGDRGIIILYTFMMMTQYNDCSVTLTLGRPFLSLTRHSNVLPMVQPRQIYGDTLLFIFMEAFTPTLIINPLVSMHCLLGTMMMHSLPLRDWASWVSTSLRPRRVILLLKEALLHGIRNLRGIANVMRNNPARSTGPGAIKNGFITFMNGTTNGYISAGVYVGMNARSITAVGDKRNASAYINRNGLDGRAKSAYYKALGIEHFHENSIYPRQGRISCMEHLKRTNGTSKVAKYRFDEKAGQYVDEVAWHVE